MVISKLIDNNIAYYYLLAEVAYVNSENEVHISIETITLQKSVMEYVCKDILNDMSNSAFVLDFAGIEKPLPNVLDEAICKISNKSNEEDGKNVILANIKKSIVESTPSLKLHRAMNSKYLGQDFYTFFSLCEIECDKLLNHEDLFKKTITRKLKEYKGDKVLNHSSSVYVSAYIDIKRFITSDKSFFLYCIYRLASDMRNKWKKEIESTDKPILICQSLNGSIIASLLSSLLNLDLFILDSIGPINKLYRSLGATIKPGKNYIVVSDVVCMGTEVKITKNIIEYLGGVYCGNVSIVRVKSFKTYDDIESVFYIDENNMKEFDYRIITPLDNDFLNKTQ